MSLRDFSGQGLAITFFFTRCPIPDYCPRLSRNFQEASSLRRTVERPTPQPLHQGLKFSHQIHFADGKGICGAVVARTGESACKNWHGPCETRG